MNTESYDRTKDVKQFDDAKTGVKGLVDAGITTIPRFFIQPPDILSDLRPNSTTPTDLELIPTIDLSGFDHSDQRQTIVENIGRASRELGLFQIINHGIEVDALERVIKAIKGFHEQPVDVKARLYRRDINSSIAFFSNIDLFHSKAATWKDTLQLKLGPTLPELDEIPEICRNVVVEWNQNVTKLADVLIGLLCDGLGVEKRRMEEMNIVEGRMMVAHYYPYCPQPDLTVGIKSHTDPGALTILLQDQKGGLQVKFGDQWVDVKPVPGALVINIGDLLQIMSNDEYKSIEHRVLANRVREPRISTAVFLTPSGWDSFYGPLAELVSSEKPAHYRQFTYTDFMRRFHTKELDGKSLINYYRLLKTE
ncbi:hypothetical protein LWI28_004256 [Acer negundo]|uniref:Fe2OG dioxygenase domain-containing protein n=1 Tax=Acer negundo TaxID=4023 RepID=A0AAD5IKI6_ACENE|nr:hypothetical protein LWI28_004256 [Acer negundo]KAK4851899.1 hypothetical protein QYF36_019278 [Acer negundo]